MRQYLPSACFQIHLKENANPVQIQLLSNINKTKLSNTTSGAIVNSFFAFTSKILSLIKTRKRALS